MFRFRSLLMLTAITCLTSCHPEPVEGPVTIKIIDAGMINIPIEKILPNSDFIPLEVTPESALGRSALFLDCTSDFFLMDSYQKKVVYQFDPSGRFIRTIGKQGKGPGEYANFSGAIISKNGVEFLSPGSPSKIYKYAPDGKFIRTDKVLDRYVQSFAVNPKNGNYYFFCIDHLNLIQEVDGLSMQRIDSFLIRNTKISLGGLNSFSTSTLGLVLCYQLFDNRIFGVGNDTIKIRYQFDVGTNTPNYNELTSEGQMKLLQDGVFWYVYKALENTRWLYLLVSKEDNADETQSQFYGLLYEKKSGKIYRLPDSPEPGPLFYPAFALGEDDILYTAVQPITIYESAEWKAEFTKRNIPLTPDGNLIVVRIPIGKIIQ